MNDKTAIEYLKTIAKRDDWTSGEIRHFAKTALAALDAEKQSWVIVTDKHELVGGDGVKKYLFDGDNKSDITTKRYQCGKCKRILHEDVGHGWCPYCGIKLLWPVGKGEENE